MNLSELIAAYQTDPTSSFHALRYHVRENHRGVLRRLGEQYGSVPLADIRARDLRLWHMGWSAGGKLSIAKSFLTQLSVMAGFGLTMLEDVECERLALVLSKLRFPKPTPRKNRITATQTQAFIEKAHEFGWHSMAFAQAIQFELTLRQKDVIGELVPECEPGESDVRFDGLKWLRGIRWDEVNEKMILVHTTSKKQKDIHADLTLAPMIVDELAFLGGRKASGPIIVSECTGKPWAAAEYRRKWRMVADAAGIPKDVKSRHARQGGISEAFEAKVDRNHIRQSATHSSVNQTEQYNCADMDLEIRSEVMRARVEARQGAGR